MEKDLPQKLDRETLLQLPAEQLVEMIIEQAIATEELNKRILELAKVETQQVAQLVEHPIEIVEYHRYTCVCQLRNPSGFEQ